MRSNLAMEKRNMGLVSLLPAVYLHTRSSGSSDSPPEMRSTWGSRGDHQPGGVLLPTADQVELPPTCLSSAMPQVLATALLRWATVSRARDISRVIMEPVSTRKM